jgi:hypothetical protein
MNVEVKRGLNQRGKRWTVRLLRLRPLQEGRRIATFTHATSAAEWRKAGSGSPA